MKPSTVRVTLAAVVLCIGIGACSADVASPPASVAPLVATTTRDGVRVTLTLDGPPRSGELSWATIRIENQGAAGVRWAGGGCGDPGSIFIDVRQAFDPGREWPGLFGRFKTVALGMGGFGDPTNVGYEDASRIGRNVACPASLSIEEQAPRAELSMRAGWDGSIQGAAAPPGPATVTGWFPFIGIAGLAAPNETDTKPITVAIETSVTGDGRAGAVLSPALVIDAALADPQFAAWVQAAPEATWINPELTVIEGVWHVGLFRRDRQTDLYGAVMVDQTGTIVGRRF